MSQQKKSPFQHRVKALSRKANIIDYCIEAFPILGSKTAVKAAIQQQKIILNQRAATLDDFVKNGDFIKLEKSKRQSVKKSKFDLDIPIIYEDDYLIIVNKPGGIAVNGNRNKTVENAVIGLAKRSTQPDVLAAPTAVHRLDVPTKGLIILAKTKTALIHLNKAFQAGKVNKVYYAIVHGETPESGSMQAAIDGKKSRTDFEQLRTMPSRIFGHFSLVKLKPITGRTHQLRIHLEGIRHLIVGDKLYAKRQKTILGKGLFLCACELRFQHPISGEEMDVKIEIPTRFLRLVTRKHKKQIRRRR